MSTKKIAALVMVFVGVGILAAIGLVTIFGSRKPTAGLRVESTPPSTVFVNDTQVGTTPLEKNFPPGEATVKIIPNATDQSLPTYQTKVRLYEKVFTTIRRDFAPSDQDTAGEIISVQPQSGQTSSLSVVTSSPDSASVTLDGQPQGFTPLIISSISSGDHQILISAPGFTSRTISAQAFPGFKLLLNVKLAGSAQALNLPTPSPSATPSATISVTPKTTKSSSPTSTPKVTPTPALPRPYVQILTTPTGFLRIRSGPGREFSELGQVLPGQAFPLLTTLSDWYQIRVDLASTSSAWISSQYAQKYD